MIYAPDTITVRVNKQIVLDNIIKVKAKSKNAIAVLKGNAYGCGLVEMAELCIGSGINFVAVSYFAEARILHERFGDRLKILILLPLYDTDQLQYALNNHIRLTVTNEKQLRTIGNLANIAGDKAIIHIKVDSGLGRLGVQLNIDICSGLINSVSTDNCIIEGLYTHLSRANESRTIGQLTGFDKLIQRLTAQNLLPPMVHALSSAQLGDEYKEYRYDAVRVGSDIFAQNNPLQVVTHIIDTKIIQKGAAIGYGQDFIMAKTANVGFIPVGYSLGLGLEPISRYNDLKGIVRVFRSILSKSKNKDYQGSVTINNKKYPVVGRVGMNISAVLLGDYDVPVGSEVVLSLRQAGLPDNINREYV